MQIHATTVAVGGSGLLILGPSGAGKSTLALQMMAVGAVLVADDRTDLRRDGGSVIASCPDAIRGRIEARGVGILAADPSPPVVLAYVVDLGAGTAAGSAAPTAAITADRLPQSLNYDLLGLSLPLVRTPYRPHLYAALRQLLLGGRVA